MDSGYGFAEHVDAEELAALRDITQHVPGMLAYWDAEQRCVFANEEYRKWFDIDPDELRGETMEQLLGDMYAGTVPHIEGALRGERQHFEREFPDPAGGRSRYCQVDYVPVVSRGGVRGFVVMVAEVTERKHLELDLQRTVEELQAALAKVRALSGLLPICAWCSRIRDDAGYYQRIEAFLSAQTHATFSHCICPECERALSAAVEASEY